MAAPNLMQPMEQTINGQDTEPTPISNQPQMTQPTKQPNNKSRNKIGKKTIIYVIAAIATIILLVVIVKKFSEPGSGGASTLSLATDTPIKVQKDGKYGYINSNGKFVIEPKYSRATEFYGGFAEVEGYEVIDGKSTSVAQVIDTKGNAKATVSYASDIRYISNYKVWIINDQLYDSSLKKLSADGIEVNYEDYGYLKWQDDKTKTAGIMNTEGKITYTYKYANGEDYLSIEPSNVSSTLKEKYCLVTIEGEKTEIVNCDTGKVAYDFTDKYISVEGDNIFIISELRPYKFVSKMYIQDDKVMYQTSSEHVAVFYNGHGYLTVRDDDKSYKDKDYKIYIILSTGETVYKEPSSLIAASPNEWEEYTGMEKNHCDMKVGLKKGDTEILSCEWSGITYLDLELYKYLDSMGKKYVLAKKTVNII